MNKAKYLLILVLAVLAGLAGFQWTKGNVLKGKTENVGLTKGEPTKATATAAPTPNFPKIIGDFLITDKAVCQENGKPLVYFFGSSTCPHCTWEKPVAKAVFDLFKNQIAYHENFDSQADGDVFQKYSDINPGYVPFLVLGCKYARMGAGENLGKDAAESKKLEAEALTAILCKLTNGQPAGVCAAIKDKTAAIK